MIQFIISPDEAKIFKNIKLFLAGGVSCYDWQSIIMEKLFDDSESKNHDYLCNVIVFNPRRQKFSKDIKEEIEKQSIWRYNKLKESDIIAFWFSKGSLSPVSLYELGKWGNSTNKSIIIGIEEEYEKRNDIEIQTKLSRPDIKIVYDLNDFYYNIITEIKKIYK